LDFILEINLALISMPKKSYFSVCDWLWWHIICTQTASTILQALIQRIMLYYKCKVPHSPLHSLLSGGLDGTDHQQKMALVYFYILSHTSK